MVKVFLHEEIIDFDESFSIVLKMISNMGDSWFSSYYNSRAWT